MPAKSFTPLSVALRQYFSANGKIGGSAKSQAKAKSSRDNLEKARALRWKTPKRKAS